MDDEFGEDVEFTSAVAADRAPMLSSSKQTPKVVQPKPQALVSRSGPSAILVSPRQKGNDVLQHIKSYPWEWSDIPADFVVGATTCALFLSIKYHKLHPEYIYNRIRGLQGRYNLRIILTLVDVDDHEATLKELSKTSTINNVTVILSWSFAEAARYLELFKTFEHSGSKAIQGHRSESYGEKMVDFITVPRGINKTDAASLVANFGSIRTAIAAGPEEIAMVPGWGQTKVKRWCSTVREPFRLRKAAKRNLGGDSTRATLSTDVSIAEGNIASRAAPRDGPAQSVDGPVPAPASAGLGSSVADKRPPKRAAEEAADLDVGIMYDTMLAEGEQEAIVSSKTPAKVPPAEIAATQKPKKKRANEELSEGVAAALAKLRDQG